MNGTESSTTIRERIGYVFSWLRSLLRKEDCGLLTEESETGSLCSDALKTVADKSSDNGAPFPAISGSIQTSFCDKAKPLSFCQPCETKNSPSECTQMGSTQRQVLKLNEFSPSPGDDSLDKSGVFSFLDSVISGQHNELLKEMGLSCLSGGGTYYSSAINDASTKDARDLLFTNCERDLTFLGGTVEVKEFLNSVTPSYGSMVDMLGSNIRGGSSSAARSLKDYELIAYLGKGTFAEVTLARHKRTHKLFALKKISKRKVLEEGCVQHTFTERQLLASLSHPFLVRLHQAFQCRTHLYLVLDFAAGGDFFYFLEKKPWVRYMQRKLQSMWKSHQRSTPKSVVSNAVNADGKKGGAANSDLHVLPIQALKSFFTRSSIPLVPDDSRVPICLIAFCAIEIALVLQHLHEHGFVYRDLKPENVLMMRNGHVVLTDFGVAKYRGMGNTLNSGLEQEKSFAGTTQYMSPEMLLGKPHDSRIDWWSFGCMLFEMATGRRPFGSENQYVTLQSIVERDLQISPDDFLITSLELETRTMQLYTRHKKFILHMLRSTAACRPRDAESMGEGRNACRGEEWTESETVGRSCGISANEHFCPSSSRLQQPVSISCTENSVQCDDWRMKTQNLSFGLAEKATNGETAMLFRDLTPCLHHARKEIEEACRLLQELILSLLQRNVEQRLSGAAVLEHPFFSCVYVTSQLYYSPLPSSVEGLMDTFCSVDKMGSGPPATSLNATETKDDSLPQVVFPFMVSPSNSHAGNEMHLQGGEINENLCYVNAMHSHECLSIDFFLGLPPIQRPDNWRELFLNGMVQPLYIPQLRAADDLRYFPAAVTAAGNSIVEQQRVLRRQMHLKNIKTQEDSIIEYENVLLPSPVAATFSEVEDVVEPRDSSSSQRETPLCQVAGKKKLNEALPNSPPEEPTSDVSSTKDKTNVTTQFSLAESKEKYSSSFEVAKSATALNVSTSVSDLPWAMQVGGKWAESALQQNEVSEDENDIRGPMASAAEKGLSSVTSCSELPPKVIGATRVVPPQHHFASCSPSLRTDGKRCPGVPLAISVPEVVAYNMGLRTSTFNVTPASTLSHAPPHFNKDGMRDSTSSVFSRFTTDEEDILFRTIVDSIEVLPETLHGVAYDVDDYLPCAPQVKDALLLSCTGIPMCKQGDLSNDDEAQQKMYHQHSSLLKPGELLPSAFNTTTPVEMLPPCLSPSPCCGKNSAEACTAAAHRGHAVNQFTTIDTRRVPNSSMSSVRGCRQLIPRGDSRELSPTGYASDDQVAAHFAGNASAGGTNGMQHYLGFTFDAHSGSNFLSGGGAHSPDDVVNFSI